MNCDYGNDFDTVDDNNSVFGQNLKLEYRLSTLYAKDKNGKIKSWSAAVFSSTNSVSSITKPIAVLRLMHGYVDGKQQISYRDYVEGKNIGKKNETTPLIQCLNEAQRKWTDKKEKEGYSETLLTTESVCDDGDGVGDGGVCCSEGSIQCIDDAPIYPMLAQSYEPNSSSKKKTIVFPCFVQPKLDGVRCITYVRRRVDKSGYEIIHQSRTGAIFGVGLQHLTNAISCYLFNNQNIVLDGELYTDEMPFEELVGLVKKKKILDEDILRLRKVKYHIYDILDKSNLQMSYTDRLRSCVSAVNGCRPVNYESCVDYTVNNHVVVMVRTIEIRDIADFRRWFASFIEEGYEGIMLRNKIGIYRTNYRSSDLQKYKEFLEDEYLIIGFKEAEGRDKGTVIWNCITVDETAFWVRPRGTLQKRRELFQHGHEYIGKKLTVIYQELTEEGKPRFPVGKAIRDGY
jgi:DNA ligase-1